MIALIHTVLALWLWPGLNDPDYATRRAYALSVPPVVARALLPYAPTPEAALQMEHRAGQRHWSTFPLWCATRPLVAAVLCGWKPRCVPASLGQAVAEEADTSLVPCPSASVTWVGYFKLPPVNAQVDITVTSAAWKRRYPVGAKW